MSTEFRKLRKQFGLRLRDVMRGTGLSVDKISKVERGLITLSPYQQGVLERFYRDLAADYANSEKSEAAKALLMHNEYVN